MFKPHRWRYPKTVLILLVIVLSVLVRISLAGDTGPLPATNWNPENLKKIEAAAIAEPLTFAVLGDNREHPEILGQILKLIDTDPSLPFAIHLGDMVKEGDLKHYRPFFNEVRPNLHKPMVTVIGNHELRERGLKLYQDIFGPDHYSFQLNNNFFIVTNDSNGVNYANHRYWKPTPEEIRWMEEQLQKSQQYKTRLVFLHVPLYDPRKDESHCVSPDVAPQLLNLFKKYKVTYVFAAHIHDYYAGAWDGVPFTITGGAGAPLYGSDPEHAFFHYLKVTVTGDKVQVEVRRWTPQEKK